MILSIKYSKSKFGNKCMTIKGYITFINANSYLIENELYYPIAYSCNISNSFQEIDSERMMILGEHNVTIYSTKSHIIETKIKLNVVSYDEVEMFKARDGNIIIVLNDEIVVYNTNNKVLSKGRKGNNRKIRIVRTINDNTLLIVQYDKCFIYHY